MAQLEGRGVLSVALGHRAPDERTGALISLLYSVKAVQAAVMATMVASTVVATPGSGSGGSN
jgi:hypothetical protein